MKKIEKINQYNLHQTKSNKMKSVDSSLCMSQNVNSYCYSDQGSPQLHLSYRTRSDETGANLYIRTGELADPNSLLKILEVKILI